MESEKVKEIKEALECLSGHKPCNLCSYHELAEMQETCCINVVAEEVIDYINYLESENERLLKQRNKTFNIWVKDTEQLKDRIAELENTDYYKEIEKKKEDLLCKEYGLMKYEKEIVGKYLKQFAERLKEKAVRFSIYEAVKINAIDETLKEFMET